jgi:formylglycine-generating enzyme required for sulfatase activity/serine/threonine protein kinase
LADFVKTLAAWEDALAHETNGTFTPERTYRGKISDQSVTDGPPPPPPPTSTAAPKSAHNRSSTSPWAAYELTRVLGRGGMGLVYSARQRTLSRDVALKKSLSKEGNRRFVNEAIISGALQHPNIVPVYDLIEAPTGEVGMAMKLLTGGSWYSHLKRDWAEVEQLTEERLHWHMDVLYKVCQAVAYAHNNGVIHNDLKPDNVMVGEYGEVALMDWGCATSVPGFKHPHPLPLLDAAKIRSPFGTPCYMAPEQAQGNGQDIHVWTDTFLLGAILYRIIEGHPLRTSHDLRALLKQATEGEYPPPERCTSPMLRTICERALRQRPEERYQSVDEMLEALAGYQKSRASERLCQEAQVLLDKHKSSPQATERETETVLIELGEAVYGFQQALLLWNENPVALSGVIKARVTLIHFAIEQEDLQLAAAHLEELDKNSTEYEECATGLRQAQTEKQSATAAAKRNRNLLRIGSLALILSLLSGYLMVKNQHTETDRQRILAAERLEEIQALSDVQRVQNQEKLAAQIWPPNPANVPAMKDWIETTETLLAKFPRHQAALKAMVERSEADADGRPQFGDATLEWEFVTLTKLVTGLTTLEQHGLPQMRARLQSGLTLEKRSLVDEKKAWDSAIAAIQSAAVYGGLRLSPQLGLVPIGANPQTGLWEFAHLESGDKATSSSPGELERDPNTGIVLVLVPGGSFFMGAQPPSTDGSITTNRDPRATSIEQPVHSVTLDPFFLSKYELTQGQWLRIMETNPSAYLLGRNVGDPEVKKITALHPVEQVTWRDSMEAMRRYDLTLPTEAQWEYATRAGTNTIYWSGDTIESLDNTLNIADRYCASNGGPGSWKYEMSLYDGYVAHAPVGQYQANRFGLHDMTGNVWEWCLDRFGSYRQPTKAGSGERLTTTADAPRVFRGGGFRAASVHARSADRYTQYAHEYQGYDVGLRPARAIRTSHEGP